MTLTDDDIKAIAIVIDEKLKPVHEFMDFAKAALLSLLDESQEHFEQKLPERVKKLEDIHLGGHHAN